MENQHLLTPKLSLYFLKGLPASGKSTWSAEAIKGRNIRILNKDRLRICNPGFSEKQIVARETELVRAYLGAGISTIVDNTHLNPVHEERLRKVAAEYRAEFVVIDHFLAVPMSECVRRDALREKPVGKRVIKEMWQKWLYTRPEPYPVDETLPWVVICDIDGTIADCEGVRNYFDYTKVYDDRPRNEILTVVQMALGDAKLMIFSGRDDSCHALTFNWLWNKTPFTEFKLVMRRTGDKRNDTIVKREMFDEHIRGKYNVRAVFDDRPRVVKMWQSLGLPVFCVNRDYDLDF